MGGDSAQPSGDPFREGGAEEVLSLAEEVVRIGKRKIETGLVRVSVTTQTAEEVVRETLRSRKAEVERVPLGHEVTEAPQTRQEGDVLVVPVVEEILVIEKRLILKEEIRLRFVDTETAVEQSVQRRVQRATVERLPPHDATASSPGTVEGVGHITNNSEESAR
ncbi:YsnF/AvaK domain-containing protein [Roseicella sp. DB1501]|uniref:YsnF/AvaK domain-containing protein n=1 Tax=Roseicella sp. DB1501 TaxID=2730925 RepID=UPI0014926647|nr:YsnF/AvaK domain-containing protein [Roseicella sp. DB1501]NOG74174.1 YsnF/AvaK domain-containing protein [Roseicella sp. DB1501]